MRIIFLLFNRCTPYPSVFHSLEGSVLLVYPALSKGLGNQPWKQGRGMSTKANHKKKKRCRSKSVVRSRKRRLGQVVASTARHVPREDLSTFEAYVRTENFLNKEDHAGFFQCLRSPLPVSFIARTPSARTEFLSCHSRHAVPLPGIAGGWQLLGEPNYTVRRWLTQNSISGHVSRQEFVSMLPVLLLDIQSKHHVLDMCASPGSKTIQAVDSLYAATSDETEGIVVANELNPKRAYILAHRCSRTLQERQRSVAVVCHNATKFPNVAAPLVHREGCFTGGIYDRIICDVPCSGDGTLRKDTKVWKTWHPTYGRMLHPLQLRIAKRALALLRVGGYMTYSTCSFHPIENEAVVAALLETGCAELISPHERLGKNIVYRQGLSHWTVLDDDCQEVDRGDASWPNTCWPPHDANQHPLHHCVRMIPQDNDTCGFFIALLRKVREFLVPSRNNKKSRQSLVTPKRHHLYVTSTGNKDGIVYTKRSKTSSKCFSLNTPLADHLLNQPGSAKLNIVYAGQVGMKELFCHPLAHLWKLR